MTEPVIEPYSRDDLLAAFADVSDEASRFWGAFAPDDFVAPIGSAWSPADNVRHLVKSTRAVASALSLPQVDLRERFGRPSAASRPYARLRADYLRALEAGGTAGAYAPSPVDPPRDLAAWQAEQIDTLALQLSNLQRALTAWPDGSLDDYQLPHPLLGTLTVREMLCFTHYHSRHHIANVERSRAASRGTT